MTSKIILGTIIVITLIAVLIPIQDVSAVSVVETKITASDGAAGDQFGYSVSISGDRAIVGAFGDDDDGDASGSAYIYDFDGSNWNETKLTASDAALDDQFGYSVSVSGDRVIVGAWGDDDNGNDSGSAYIMEEILNNPPDCTLAAPSQDSIYQDDTIWPPNHKMENISIIGVADADGDRIAITIDAITQDESTSGTGDGDQSPDGAGIGTDTAQIRAERSGTGDGRVYEISFTADDVNGGTCTGSVFVEVPHDKNSLAVISGQNFDSTVP